MKPLYKKIKCTANYLLTVSLLLSGCIPARRVYTPPPRQVYTLPKTRDGFYYTVKKGDTLFSISRAHNIKMQDIIDRNHLPDPGKLEIGQKLFIPLTQSYIWPVRGRVVNFFGESMPGGIKNRGIDIKAPEGSRVVASREGRVVFYETNFKGLGKVIIIEHSDGYRTLYGSNREIYVKLNDYVKQGQLISTVGNTGRKGIPHLHFQIRKGHAPVDPLLFLQ
ncbi:hypothetical protein B9J78_05325 [bacterium Unc6]|nr:hypothetical protein [bacterium Unc6]